LTVVQFMALQERWGAKDALANRRIARICMVLANIHRGKRRPFKEDDFMPKPQVSLLDKARALVLQAKMLNKMGSRGR
jgi:hypothetical protein